MDTWMVLGSFSEKHVQPGIQTQSDRQIGLLSFSGDPPPSPASSISSGPVPPETKKETSRASHLCGSGPAGAVTAARGQHAR